MRFQSTLGAIALLLARANARITGFSMPETIKIGEEFALKMDGVPSPDTEWPLHVVFWFDYKLVDHDYLKFHTLATYQIGNDDRKVTGPIILGRTVDTEAAPGQYSMRGAVYILTGGTDAPYVPHVEHFQVNFALGDTTSDKYVQSTAA